MPGFPYRPLVGVANLSFGDVEANQAPELARIRQEEVLFSAPEADVDEDVVFADLGRLKHLEAEPLLALFEGLRARDRVPVVQELAVLLEQFQGGLEQVVLSRDSPRERGGDVSHGRVADTRSGNTPRDTAANGHRPNTTTYRGRYA